MDTAKEPRDVRMIRHVVRKVLRRYRDATHPPLSDRGLSVLRQDDDFLVSVPWDCHLLQWSVPRSALPH